MSIYPCVDEMRRYRSFPCSQCKAPDCLFGKKPAGPKPKLAEGQRHCGHCSTPFRASGRNRYCSETCRYQAMMKRRRARKVGAAAGAV